MAADKAAARAAGARAESLACEYLRKHGLHIVARNVRSRFGEIDVIARDGDVLVFVEVRLRRSGGFGGAAESITPAKRARLLAAAQSYLAALDSEPACRIDAILFDGTSDASIDWRRDIATL